LLAQRYTRKLDDDGREFLDYVVDAVRRMDMLLSDLLTYSQHLGAGPAVFQHVSAQAVLIGVLMNLQASIQETRAEVTYDEMPDDVTSDFAQLGQVFQNLIGNALKYRGSNPPKIHIGVAETEDEWIFTVKDNGLGIEPAYKDQIFGVFKRLHGREYPGTGMGLAICKKIVERHGGRIWVESEPGKGSTFSFSLPK
jgi:chemotaxis family two-component system sensor kinase Cph1